MKTKFILFFLLLSIGITYAQTIRYVKPTASGNGNGSSWANASADLQGMINASATNDQVWVAAGTYKPTTGTDRGISFNMKNGVAIYGGFPNTGNPVFADRNWATNETTLSGDIGTVGVNTDNSHRIIYNSGLSSSAILDGVTICDAYNPNSTNGDQGAGVRNENSSPTFRNCIIRNNYTGINGGGVANNNGSPSFYNCIFKENIAGFAGGGMQTQAGNPTIINCTFNNNRAYLGGAIFGNFSSTNYILSNCIIWGNTGTNGYNFFFDNQGSSANVTYSIIQGGYNGTGNLNSDPLFTNAAGGDFSLQRCSPAINAGNNTGISGVDLANNPRIYNSGIVDMGAYEYQGVGLPSPTRLYVKATATGANNGLTWADAFTDLQSALNYSCKTNLAEIWVAKGTYKPTADPSGNTSPSNPRTKAFVMLNGVAIYGGFSGTETLLSERNWATNKTILSGEIGAAGTSDNAYRIINNTFTTDNRLQSTAVLDGFTLEAANANGSFPLNLGGAIWNTEASPTIKNCIFRNNFADAGGGIFFDKSSSNVSNCLFINNSCSGSGSAISCGSGTDGVKVLNSTFYGNTGGTTIENQASARYTNCIIWGNSNGVNRGNFNNSIVQGGHSGTGNLDTNPLFTNAASEDFSLQACSPAINSGDNTGISGVDLANNPRIFGSTIDLGAYEYQGIWVGPSRLYVNEIATGANNGLNWADAFTDFQSALSYSCKTNLAEIWVAAGTYKPSADPSGNTSPSDPRTKAFVMLNGVAIYGGFSGTETQLSERNWVTNKTILSGEIGAAGTSDNAYRIINNTFTAGNPLLSTAVLDGFTLEAAYANGPFPQGLGGAIWNTQSSPTIRYCVFRNNFAVGGGGIFFDNSSSNVSNCLFIDNSCSGSGSAISCGAGTADVKVLNSTFFGNTGGTTIENEGSAKYFNCIVWGNSAGVNGGNVTNSIIQGGYGGTGNLNTNPLFVNAAGGDFSLLACSSAINTGDNTDISGVDFANNPRVFGSTVDLGAYEYQGNPGGPARLYINDKATGANTGLTWADAFTDLQLALNYSCKTNLTEIWVAAGTYRPALNTSFSMLPNVAILGGFPNTGNPAIIDRNWSVNPTILQGNGSSVIFNDKNGLDNSAILDGFTITGGNNRYGGGIYNNEVSPRYLNCSFFGNQAINNGGGFSTGNGSPIITNCTFSGNQAPVGGGMYIISGSPTITNCSFSGNPAYAFGGAIYNTGTPQIKNCILWGNGIEINSGVGNPTIINSIIQGQNLGAGVFNGSTNPLFVNQPSIGLGTTGDLRLNPCSPAIDMGATGNDVPSTDFLGNPRFDMPNVGTSTFDLGAYEVQAAVPIASPVINVPIEKIVCSPNNLILTATCTTGNLMWNDGSTATTLTLSIVGTYSLSVTCVYGNCTSDASTVSGLEIKAKPTAPTITPPTNAVVCSPNNLILMASCTIGTVLWSDNTTGTSLTLSSVGTYSISAKCVLNGCESDLSSATSLEIKSKPSVPTVTPPTNTAVCSPNTLILTANCTTGTVLWSNNSTGTSLTISSVGTYSISAKCVLSGCESDPSSATSLEIKAKPSVPNITPPTNTVVCSPNTLTLTANCTTGTVLWSDNSTGTSLTISSVGTYSISAKCVLSGCESDPSSATSLEIKAKPSVPTITPPTNTVVCSPNSLTLTANCTTGTVLWSNNSTGTSLTISSVGTYSISAKCQLNGCESNASDAVNLEIKAKPSVPTITPPTNTVVCTPNTLTLTANCTTGTVLWSDNSTGTSLTLSAVGTYAISAKCILNGCESDPSSAVSLEIKSKPSVPTVTPPTNTVVCSPNTLTLTANCTTGTILWSDNSAGTSLTISSVGTYSISAKCVLNGCESDPSSATSLEIKSKPSVPTVTPPTNTVVCSPNSLTLTANCTTGTVLWSNNSTGTSLNISSVGTYSISAKCVLNGCESDASSTTSLEIKSKPNVPTITPPTNTVVCSPNSLTLTANCTTGMVLWSDNSIGTSLTISSVGTYSISAKCVLNGCESDASSATSLEIKAKPSVPTITPPTNTVVCSPNTLTLTANCTTGTVLWSNNSTGTSLTISSVGTYSISAKCVLNGCESDASSATSLEIKAKPSLPTITSPTNTVVCSPNSLTLTANCTTGTVLWSDNSTGTSLNISSVGTYSISAKCVLNGCESDASSAVSLEIKSKPNVPTITPPTNTVVCSPNSLTLTANCTTGTVLWSNNSTGTSLTISSVGTYSISAKCVLNGCESDASSATSLEIKAKPSIPTITPPTTTVVCSPNTLTLTANCTTGMVLWSDNSTGTSLTISSVGTYSISAKCVLNGCESDASSATSLQIKSKPNVPTITPPTNTVVCSPNTLTFTANCTTGTVLWSDNSTGTSLTISSVGTYSISAKCVLNGCESDPSSATSLEIKSKPSVPTITPPTNTVVCSPNTLTLTANCNTGTVLWSNNSTGTSLTISSVGTYSVSAKCVSNGCESDPSSATSLEIKSKPSVPTIIPPTNTVVCSPNSLTLTANCTTGTVLWSDNSTGTSLTISLVGTYSISAKCVLNGCESDATTPVSLEIKVLPNVTATNTGPYTVGQSISLAGNGGGNYSWAGPNNFSSTLSTPMIPTALLVNGGVYTLTVVGVNGCSAIATTNVVVSGVDPCDPSRIVDYFYVKAGNPHQSLFNLTDGMVINQVSEQISVLVTPSLCPAVIIESFEMNIQGPELNWNILQNVAPNALFDNVGTDIWGRNFKPGNYTLTVTGYAQDNKGGGITYGPKIIRFTVVGNLATINAPMLSKNTICAGSSVDVSFNTTGTFNSSNEFRVELSDSSGSFATPVLIGTTNRVGTLSCIIPQNTLEGVKYLIRVSSSNQVVVSNPAISQVTIHPYSYNLVSPANNLSGTKTKKAVTSISANNKVISPTSVTYQAGKAIVLTPGFESGAVFKAEIRGCED